MIMFQRLTGRAKMELCIVGPFATLPRINLPSNIPLESKRLHSLLGFNVFLLNITINTLFCVSFGSKPRKIRFLNTTIENRETQFLWFRIKEKLSSLTFSCILSMAGVVVVFDFDKTIIDCDSDNWVIDELGATDLFNQLLPTMPWNSVMVSFLIPLFGLELFCNLLCLFYFSVCYDFHLKTGFFFLHCVFAPKNLTFFALLVVVL